MPRAKPVKKLSKALNLLGKETKRRVLYYRPGFKRFVGQNQGVLADAFLLLKKMAKTHEKEMVKNGVRVSRKVTGSQKEGSHCYKVSAGGMEFFVKAKPAFTASEMLDGMEKLDRLLKEKGGRVNGFNVKAVKPLLLYKERDTGRPYLVTPFYKKGEVEQVSDVRGEKGVKARQAIFLIQQEILERHPRISEIRPKNAFLQKASNTLLLFDLQARSLN